MSILAAVDPKNDAFAGGTLARAGNPTAVGGGFAGAGAQGFPAPGTPPSLSARTNSRSNVRIPYARLVPQRGDGSALSHRPKEHGDNRTPGDRPLRNEYDGLESGELAWILGRRFVGAEEAVRGAADDEFGNPETNRSGAGGAHPSNARPVDMTRASAHGLGMGFGPDRMQRLTYTDWLENWYASTFATATIDLFAMPLADNTSQYLSSELRKYAPLLYGSTVMRAVDVPHVYASLFHKSADGYAAVAGPFPRGPGGTNDPAQSAPIGTAGIANAGVELTTKLGDNAAVGHRCGLFLMDRGPFLRGCMNNASNVEVPDPTSNVGLRYSDLEGRADGPSPSDKPSKAQMPRNLGDDLAFDSLYAHMKALSMFDWSPDGLVLSKLESPSGDPLNSAALDARQAMLFNVAVQGPAIAKTWTGDPKMQTMPLDKVFVVLCADILWELQENDGGAREGGVADAANANGLWQEAGKSWLGDPTNDFAAQREAAIQALPDRQNNAAEFTAYFEALGDRERALRGDDADPGLTTTPRAGVKDKKAAYDAAQSAKDKTMRFPTKSAAASSAEAEWDELAGRVKTGDVAVTRAVMTNFHLRRVTSSYLLQNSAHIAGKGKEHTRCGMKLGVYTEGDGAPRTLGQGEGKYAGQFIIGGWCIGTVLDNSASRSSIGHQTRTAPASCALNINVGVEWWSGDKLHRHYMDNGVLTRNEPPDTWTRTLFAFPGFPEDDDEARAARKAEQATARATGNDVPSYQREEPTVLSR